MSQNASLVEEGKGESLIDCVTANWFTVFTSCSIILSFFRAAKRAQKPKDVKGEQPKKGNHIMYFYIPTVLKRFFAHWTFLLTIFCS